MSIRPQSASPLTIAAMFVLAVHGLAAAQSLEPSRAATDPAAPDAAALLELARTDLAIFAEMVTAGAETTRAKAGRIVSWYARNLDWTATDYERRSVQEILRRGGGNCDELARVAVATLDAVGMTMRRVREINLHREDRGRQERAAARVREHGPASSVFGLRHNDHVWLEIHDPGSDTWFPADPSLGLVGEEEWVRARIGFGERVTVDPSASDMIAPFALFAAGPGGELIDRSQHYLVTTFDRVYGDALSRLPSWPAWIEAIDRLNGKARGAFLGEYDLHRAQEDLDRAHQTYERLGSEFLDRARAHPERPASR